MHRVIVAFESFIYRVAVLGRIDRIPRPRVGIIIFHHIDLQGSARHRLTKIAAVRQRAVGAARHEPALDASVRAPLAETFTRQRFGERSETSVRALLRCYAGGRALAAGEEVGVGTGHARGLGRSRGARQARADQQERNAIQPHVWPIR